MYMCCEFMVILLQNNTHAIDSVVQASVASVMSSTTVATSAADLSAADLSALTAGVEIQPQQRVYVHAPSTGSYIRCGKTWKVVDC